MTTTTLDRLRCDHGMPTPAACIECMAVGHFLPAGARRVRSGLAGVGGYALDNDCTVQAIVRAVGVDYAEAAAALRTTDWIPGSGATLDQVRDAIATFGLTVRWLAPGVPLASLVATGRTYIVSSVYRRQGHAYVVEAGKIHNSGGYARRGRIRGVLEVVG